MAEYFRGMANDAYWEQRVKERFRAVQSVEEVMYDKYLEVYKETLEDHVELLKPYRMAGGKYNLERLRQDLQYNHSLNYKIGRYQSLFDNLDKRLNKLGVDELAEIEKHLIETYKQSYYELFYEMEKSAGYNTSFALLSEQRLKQMIHTAWTPDGIEFSERVWKNNGILADNIRSILEDSIAKGQNPRKTANLLKEATGNSFYNCQRLVRTETNAMVTDADANAYKEMGFEEYRYNAVFDNRTSDICGSLHGKKFRLDELKIGVNAPPSHPQCRSTINVVDILDYTPKFKRVKDSQGNYIKIPSTMSFEEWKLIHGIN